MGDFHLPVTETQSLKSQKLNKNINHKSLQWNLLLSLDQKVIYKILNPKLENTRSFQEHMTKYSEK